MKRVLFLFMLTFLCAFFTACGGELTTIIELEQDMSGRRIMKYEISKEEYAEYVSDPIAAVDSKIRANCPEELQYELEETKDSYIAVFTMEFASLEEAEEKITPLAREGEEYVIDCFIPEGVFCEGFFYEERFEAEAVMDWFVRLMNNTGYVEGGRVSNFIDKSLVILKYGGEIYSANSKIRVEEFSYVGVSELRIITHVNGDGTYDRTMELDISEFELKKKEQEIRLFMENSVPENAEGKWSQVVGMYTHTVSMKQMSAEQMQEAMRFYTHSEKTSFAEGEPEVFDDAEQYVLLSSDVCYEEDLDLKEFTPGSGGDVPITYQIKNANMIGELYHSIDGILPWDPLLLRDKWLIASPESQFSGLLGYMPTYDLLRTRDISLRYNGKFYYDVSEIYWNTEVKEKDNIRTEIVFIIPETVTDESISALVRNCRARIDESPEPLKVTATAKEVNGQNGISFLYEGSDSDHVLAREYLTHWKEDASEFCEAPTPISCFEESASPALTKTCVFEEYVSPMGYIDLPNEVYRDIPIYYNLDMPEKTKEAFRLTEAKDGSLQAEFTYGVDDLFNEPVGAITTAMNATGVSFLLLMITGVLSLVTVVVFFVMGIVKGIRKKRKAA